jgi:HK97 family phage prohead protease
MFGHFARFNEWAEIDSVFESHFLERIAPGAFARTLARDRGRLRVLFQHGRDPQIGDKVLGVPQTLREDELGGFYEVPLFVGTSYVADLLPGLRAGAYGSSFRFKVLREEMNDTPRASSYNPKALPERTIREVRLMEFGPVTFPAYDGATAGVRSLTDWYETSKGSRVAVAHPPREQITGLRQFSAAVAAATGEPQTSSTSGAYSATITGAAAPIASSGRTAAGEPSTLRRPGCRATSRVGSSGRRSCTRHCRRY